MEENAQAQNQVDNFISFFMPEDKENPQSLEPQLVLNTYTLDFEKNLEIAQNVLLEHPEWTSAVASKIKLDNGKEITNCMWDEDYFVKFKNPEFAKLREEKLEELGINKASSQNSQGKAQNAENTQENDNYKIHTEFKDFEEYESVFMRKLDEVKSPKAQRKMIDDTFTLGENIFKPHFKPKDELEKLEKEVTPIKAFFKKVTFYDKTSAIAQKTKDTIINTKNNIAESIQDRRNIKKEQEKNLRENKSKIKSLESQIAENAGKLANPKDCEEFVKTLMAIIDAKAQKRALEKSGKEIKEEIKEAYYARKRAEKLANNLPYSYKDLIKFAATHFSDFKNVREQTHKEHEFYQEFTKTMDMKDSKNKVEKLEDLIKQSNEKYPNFAKTYPNTFKRAESIVKLGKEQGKTQTQYQGRSA